MNELVEKLLEMKRNGEAKGLRVLDTKNDPFWVSDSRLRDAKWLSDIWQNRVNREIHDRGLHYILVSLGVDCPWGENRKVHPSPQYMNVDSDYNKTVSACRDARNWELLPEWAIMDKMHVGLEKWADYGIVESAREPKPFEEFDGEIPVTSPSCLTDAYLSNDDFDTIVDQAVSSVIEEHMAGLTANRYQPYYVAVATEKEGMRDSAKSASNRLQYGFDFLNFTGQSSSTEIKRWIRDKLLADAPYEYPIRDKKIRIFYLSDFDPAGRSMPPAFIQKMFFELWKLGVSDKLDIKVAPLALTPEIVEKYDLPPAPVPEKKLGAKTLQDRWLREFGSLVEIDSLVALYPGELENIIEGKVGRYVDTDLSKTINETLKEARETVEKSIRDVLEQKRDEFQSKKSKAKEVIDEINKLIADVYEQNKETLEGFENCLDDLESVKPDLPDFDFESDHEVDENDEFWLFDSQRDFKEQAKIMRKYKVSK